VLRADDRAIAKFAPFSLQLMAGVMSPGLTGSADDSATRGGLLHGLVEPQRTKIRAASSDTHQFVPVHAARDPRGRSSAVHNPRRRLSDHLSRRSVITEPLSQVITGSET